MHPGLYARLQFVSAVCLVMQSADLSLFSNHTFWRNCKHLLLPNAARNVLLRSSPKRRQPCKVQGVTHGARAPPPLSSRLPRCCQEAKKERRRPPLHRRDSWQSWHLMWAEQGRPDQGRGAQLLCRLILRYVQTSKICIDFSIICYRVRKARRFSRH